MILEVVVLLSCVSLSVAWTVSIVRNARLPVAPTFRNRLLGLSTFGLLTGVVPLVMLLSSVDLMPVAVVTGVSIAFMLVSVRRMDQWTTQGRIQLVREGRDAYSGIPTTRRRPDRPDLR
jgi:hypothetical protein